MKFGEAIEAAREGYAVAREGWNGKGMWIAYSPGTVLTTPQEMPWGQANRAYAEHRIARGDSHELRILPYFTMRTASGEILPGWLASQSDMLSDDWIKVSPT